MNCLIPLVVLLSLLSNSVHAQVTPSSLKQGKFLGPSLKILKSPKKLTIREAIESKGFYQTTQEVPRFGYVYDDIWAKLEIENSSSFSQETFFEFRGPIEEVTAYLTKNNKVVETVKAGMFLLPEDESFVSGHSYPVISFQLPPGSSTVYFSETAVAPHFPVVSYDRVGFENRLRAHNSVLGLIFGICIAFLLILIIICIFVNDKCNIFLISGFLSFFILIGFLTGMFRVLYFNYAGTKSSILSRYILLYPLWPIFFSLLCLSLSLFTIYHLGKENFFRTKTSKTLTWVALSSQLLLGIVSYFDTVIGMNLFSAGLNITIGQAIYWSIRKYRSERRQELLLSTIGWLFYGGFTTFQLCYFLGIAENTFFGVWGTIIGFFSLLTFLSISLVERNRTDLYRTLSEKQCTLAKLQDNLNELQKRDSNIIKLGQAVQEAERTKTELQKKAEIAEFSAQIAHDIRSPLAALMMIEKDVALLPEETRLMLVSATGRVRDIANLLLEKNRTVEVQVGGVGQSEQVTAQLLSSVIDGIVTEKRMQFRSRIGIEIGMHLDSSSYGLFAEFQATEFKRVLSNLVNNSVEALTSRGTISIGLEARDGGAVEITVKDNGKGIPINLLGKLGTRGVTHGKKDGSGLGLYHARTSCEAWGGSLSIKSQLGVGTTVSISLPRSNPPPWFVSQLSLTSNSIVVVFDDDTSIHRIWQGYFDAKKVQSSGISIIHISTPNEFKQWVIENRLAEKRVLYLVDFEFMGSNETGLDLIESLGINANSILVTSRYEEKRVQERCSHLGVPLIPKGMAGFVPLMIR